MWMLLVIQTLYNGHSQQKPLDTFCAGSGEHALAWVPQDWGVSVIYQISIASSDNNTCIQIMLQYNQYVCTSTHNTIPNHHQPPAPAPSKCPSKPDSLT